MKEVCFYEITSLNSQRLFHLLFLTPLEIPIELTTVVRHFVINKNNSFTPLALSVFQSMRKSRSQEQVSILLHLRLENYRDIQLFNTIYWFVQVVESARQSGNNTPVIAAPLIAESLLSSKEVSLSSTGKEKYKKKSSFSDYTGNLTTPHSQNT